MNPKNEHIVFEERLLMIFSILSYWDIHQIFLMTQEYIIKVHTKNFYSFLIDM